MAATTINKQQALNQVLSAVDPATEPDAPLPVLEQFIYGICRENATPEAARQAYDGLTTQFFDWNEVRVSSARELEEVMPGLGDAESRAERIIAFLQEVFETTFSFDLEAIQKKGLKQASKGLQGLRAANDFVVAWVMQRSLGGHAIPVDQATLQAARRLGLLDGQAETVEAARSSLEHMVPKSKGTHFTDAIAVLAQRDESEDELVAPARAGRVKPR